MTTIGVLGGGQLGRMLALAGYPLDIHCRFLDPAADSPAGQVAELCQSDGANPRELHRFLSGLHCVTYEFENVSVALAHQLAERLPVYPPPSALENSQDRLVEKRFLQRMGIPTAPFAPVGQAGELEQALATIKLPAVLKTRRLGYDGKGQFLIRSMQEGLQAIEQVKGQALILEGYVPFGRELSQIAVRTLDGALAFYPLVENHHAGGILRLSIAPAPGVTPALQTEAKRFAQLVLEELKYVGVLAIEFFQVRDHLIANEMAPRVHNSGHWTIEGANTSQFENHLRAVAGLPLGATDTHLPCAMVNLIGSVPDSASILAIPDAHLHLYGKEPRPGRKLGHVTLRAPSTELLRERLNRLRSLVPDCPVLTPAN